MRQYEVFFGPNINAQVEKISKEERLVAIKLVTGEGKKGTGAISDEVTKISAGGAQKLGEVAAPAQDDKKRSMEV